VAPPCCGDSPHAPLPGVADTSFINHKRRSAMKRKLASILMSLLLGWLSTAAIAEEETPVVPADSSADTTEPAATTDSSMDTATDSSASDGTTAVSPGETETK
jgi:hypothetical protein